MKQSLIWIVTQTIAVRFCHKSRCWQYSINISIFFHTVMRKIKAKERLVRFSSKTSFKSWHVAAKRIDRILVETLALCVKTNFKRASKLLLMQNKDLETLVTHKKTEKKYIFIFYSRKGKIINIFDIEVIGQKDWNKKLMKCFVDIATF